MPPLSIQSPTLVHHMAALDDQTAPPNSLEAIQACLEAAAPIIEIDITALSERDYLLAHEPELEAETSGQGAVAARTPAQARGLFIKHRGIETAYRVAVLSDVVQLFQNHHGASLLQLDFKNVIPRPNDEPLYRLVKLIEPLGERVLVSSGADWQLRNLRKIAPWLMLGFDIMWYIDWQPPDSPRDPLTFPKQRGAYGYFDDHMLASARHWSTSEYLQDRCESLMGLVPDVSAFYVEHPLLAQSLEDGFNWAEALHSRGIKLDAWTMDVTDPVARQSVQRLLAAGIDMFSTNTPRALARLLQIEKA
jgi:glycerophosphoryl diester phosphodiesterase